MEAFVGYDNSGARALANALFDSSLRLLPAQPGSRELCVAFEALFGELYHKLRLMIGHRGVTVVLRRAIVLSAREHEILDVLTTTDGGIAFAALRGRRPAADPVELQPAVLHLLTTALDDLCRLIGADLLGVILGFSAEPQRT
jgi:hypothetical protein